MNKSEEETTWRLEGNALVLKGFGFGSRYPVVVATVRGVALSGKQLEELSGLLCTSLPELENNLPDADYGAEEPFRISLHWLLDTVHRMLLIAGQPVYECGRILSIDRELSGIVLPAAPRSEKPLLDLLRILLELMDCQVQAKNPHKQLKRVGQIVTDLQKNNKQPSNIKFFMQAAFEMGVPIQELAGNVLQYGQGKRGRLMLSSFSDETPVIATTLARNKIFTAAVLSLAGIPVPDHRPANTLDTALATARQLGYPVVIKPADLDGGVGVAAGLRSPEELTAAFRIALEKSRNILVEKHVEGRDYRVTVFQGEVVSAVERVPGGVTGNGRHTVRELVEQLNADPLRGTGRLAQLKRLTWDNEAVTLLKQERLDPSSIPEPGRFVRLRRAANLATGGVPVGVFDKVHPDNRLLAVRAAGILRLDIAGVDLLMPDISRSWRQTGGVVCEVNAQPNLGGQTMGGTLYALILGKMMTGNGRIPAAVVLGSRPSCTLVRDLETRLLQQGMVPGCHDSAGVRVNGQVIRDGDIDPFSAGEMLTLDRNTDAMVLSVSDGSVLSTGLPFARFDLLVLAGAVSAASDRHERPDPEITMRELLELLLPCCDGKVITIEGTAWKTDSLRHLTTAQWEPEASPDKAMELVTAAMLADIPQA